MSNNTENISSASNTDQAKISKVEQVLLMLERAEQESVACEILDTEFYNTPQIVFPHLSTAWGILDNVTSEQCITEIAASNKKFKSALERFKKQRKVFEDLSADYNSINDFNNSTQTEAVQNKASCLITETARIIKDLKTGTKLSIGWKPYYKKPYIYILPACLALAILTTYILEKNSISKMGFTVVSSVQEWGRLKINRSVDDNKLSVNGHNCAHGLGAHAKSEIIIKPKPGATQLNGLCGIDDEVNARLGSIKCKITQNGKVLFESKLLQDKNRSESFSLPITDSDIILQINNGGNGNSSDHADWCDIIVS